MVSIRFTNASVMTLSGKEYLTLELANYEQKIYARKFAAEKPDKEHIAEIRQHRNKRTLEANNYAWCLIGKLAEALRMDPVDIYRREVREVGKFEQCLMRDEVYGNFAETWESGHIGRFTAIIGESREKQGWVWVAVYMGSSDFDTREMSVLIDNLIQECKAQKIEHLPPKEIERILGAWEANGQKK